MNSIFRVKKLPLAFWSVICTVACVAQERHEGSLVATSNIEKRDGVKLLVRPGLNTAPFPSFAVSETGDSVVFPNTESGLTVYDLRSDQPLRKIDRNRVDRAGGCLRLLANDSRIALWEANGDIQVRCLKTGEVVFSLSVNPYDRPNDFSRCVAVSQNEELIALDCSADGLLRIHEGEQGREVRTIRLPKDVVSCQFIRFTPDRSVVALVNCLEEPQLLRWSVPSGELVSQSHPGRSLKSAEQMFLSSSGRYVAFKAYSRNKLRLIVVDAQAGKEVIRQKETPNYDAPIAFSMNDNWLAYQDENGTVHVVEMATGKVIASFGSTREIIRRMEFSRHGGVLCAASDRRLRAWDLKEPVEFKATSRPTVGVHDLAISTDGRFMLTCGLSGVRCWDVSQSRTLWQRPEARRATFSEDGLVQAVVLSGQRKLDLVELRTGRTSDTIELQTGDARQPESYSTIAGVVEVRQPVTRIATSNDLNKQQLRVAYQVAHNRIGIWRQATNDTVLLPIASGGRLESGLAVNPARELLLWGTALPLAISEMDAKRERFDFTAEMQLCISEFNWRSGEVNKLCKILGGYSCMFSKSGNRCACATVFHSFGLARRAIEIWDVHSERRHRTVEWENWVENGDARLLIDTDSSFAISPDGALLAISGYYGNVYLINVDTGAHATLQMPSNRSPATCVRFSPDGIRIAAAALDGAICIWEELPMEVR